MNMTGKLPIQEGMVIDDKVDLSHSGTAVCQGLYVVKGAILRKIMLTFIFSRIYSCLDFFFLASSLLCH